MTGRADHDGSLRGFINRNRAGVPLAVPSICSSQPDVIAAAALLARHHAAPLLVEATSNQVNQFGGYTGMRAADFISFIHGICAATGLDKGQVIFGGDHLGPQAWRGEDADTAMTKAEDLVRSFVEAGFTKIHLDCSEGCLGEPAQVSDEVSGRRSARLARICETHAPDPQTLVYVVGTEVPPPGGARAGENEVLPTSPESAGATLAEQRRCFERDASPAAWNRVIGLVVQPGLEFGAAHVHHFDMASPDRLSGVLSDHPHMAFEAHSTDYQRAEVFPELARRHFAILKVGPALTFAYRQAVYALDHIADWHGIGRERRLSDTMEMLMLERPDHWSRHYAGDDEELHRLRHFSYGDRIRYYWNEPMAKRHVENVIAQLDSRRTPLPLMEQYFPGSIIARAQDLESSGWSGTRALIYAQIQEALLPYFQTWDGGASDNSHRAVAHSQH
jgi:D-tagatose-1,6-bisphosphate aldolase subunit GatZ/KbaZ